MKKSMTVLCALLGGLLLLMSINLQVIKAGEGETVTDATYGDPAGGGNTVTGSVYGPEDDWPPAPVDGGDPMAPLSFTTMSGGGDNYITFLFNGFQNSDGYKLPEGADPSTVPDGYRLLLNFDANIVTNGSGERVLRLTPAQNMSGGSAFNKEMVSLEDDRSFSTYFTFQMHGGSGADGLVFTVQADSNTKGTKGGTLGYYGISPSVAVKFDTYKNGEHGDPSDNHIAILTNGVIALNYASGDLQGNTKAVRLLDKDTEINLRSGTVHAWIDYDGATGLFEVRLSNDSERPVDAVLSHHFNPRLTSILQTDLVYVGFTASTGGLNQNHDIKTWYFTNKFDPIDVDNKTYKMAPAGYNITPVTQDDGSVKLTITPIGADDGKYVPITVSAEDAEIDVAVTDTGEEGEAVVTVTSPDGEELTTEIKVTGPGGVTSKLEITIPGRTEAPDEEDILAIATDGTVDVYNVPNGATVRVYDDSKNLLGTKTNVTGGHVQFTGLEDELSESDTIYVTFTLAPKGESEKTPAEPKFRSVLDPSKVLVNATTDKALIRDVPAGAVIRIYDAPGGNEIGTNTNLGNSADDLVVEIDPPGVEHKDKVYVTLQEPDKLESVPEEIEALEESAKPDAGKIETDGTADSVTVREVPAGATVVIYDEDGSELGRKTNGGSVADVVLDELGLEMDKSIQVTLIEKDKLESEPVTVAVTFSKSDPPQEIDANATKSVVTVEDVPAKTRVKVYDKDGNELGKKQNEEEETASVSVSIATPRLTHDQELKVTFTEPRKTESDKTPATAYYDKSAKPDEDRIVVNATDYLATVTDVEPDATVTVYADDGETVLGSNTNGQAAAADLEITLAPSLEPGDTVLVTITELYHLESDPVAVSALEKTAPLPEERIRADATDGLITFYDIPDGAEVIVYDENDAQIAAVTNNQGETADLTADADLTHGQEIRVTIQETGKLASDPTITEAREQTAVPKPEDVLDIDVDAGTVTIGNVPPGATVIIYDQDGREIGKGTSGGLTPGEVVITVGADLESEPELQITVTEPDKYESGKLTVDIGNRTEELIDDAVKDLEITYQTGDTWESVTLPIFVVSVGKHNTSVSWSSNKPGVIAIPDPVGNIIEAAVNRQPQDESVILTAYVSKNGKVKTRTFLVIVKAAGLDKQIETDTRKVKVIGGANGEVEEQVPVDRILLKNGQFEAKIDKAVFDEARALDFIGKNTGGSAASIYVDEPPGDEPDEIAVEVPEASMQLLADNDNDIEVRTDYASILIDNVELRKMTDNALDLYFRLVPVRDANEQSMINSGVRNDANVQAAASGKSFDILGSSLKIETNYSGYKTLLTIYFEKNGIAVPGGNEAEFLASLRVHIDHGDGSPTEVVEEFDPVYEGGRLVGLSFEIERFSTFTILQLRDFRNLTEGSFTTVTLADPLSGLGQIVSAVIDASRQAIVLELDAENYRVDGEGFAVSVRDEAAEIQDVVADGRFVTIRLREPLPVGYFVTVNYSPDESVSGGGEPYLLPFSGLMLPNPGYHAAYLSGFEDGTFRPDRTVTRAEIAAILAQNLNLPEHAVYQGLFLDVPSTHWGWFNIERLKGAGLLVGDTDGRFRPQDALTRSEMAMIAAKWIEADLGVLPPQAFPDVAVGHWAASAIAAVQRAGIVAGFPDGTFRPEALLTRAQAVTIINRLLGRNPFENGGNPTWPDVGADHWAYAEIEEASHSHEFMYDAAGNELRTN